MAKPDTSILKGALDAAFGQPMPLDESVEGIRATVFYVLAIAIATEMAKADEVLHPDEKQAMERILSGMDLLTKDAAAAVHSLFSSAVLEPLVAEQSLPQFAPFLDETAATLLWGVAADMAMADGELGGEEDRLLGRLQRCLPVDPGAVAAIRRGLAQGGTKLPSGATELLPIQPLRTLALGVGATRLATSLLARLQEADEGLGRAAAVEGASSEALAKHALRRHTLLNLLKGARRLAQFMDPEAAHQLDDSLRRLASGRFQLTVLGEFSRGKSTLLNAILGGPVLPRSMIPCNSGIVRIRYAREMRFLVDERAVRSDEFRSALFSTTESDVDERLSGSVKESAGVLEMPHPLLEQGVELFDTPGLNESTELERLVEMQADRSDAFVLVISAMQPATKLEIEAVRNINSRRNRTVFIACNFMNAVPDGQRGVLVKRVRNAFARAVPEADLRYAFVSAEPALQHLMGEAGGEEWVERTRELRESIGEFLCKERGHAELESHKAILRASLESARDKIQARIRNDKEQDRVRRAAEKDKIRKGLEWLRQERKAIPERRRRMESRVRKLVADLTRATCDVADSVVAELGQELPSVAKRWKSERSVLMPWEVAKDFGSKVEKFFSRELNRRIGSRLGAVTERLSSSLASDIGDDAAKLYDMSQGIQTS